MSKTRYIGANGIIRLNARALRDTVEPINVLDESGLKGLAGRPAHTHDGIDLVPDLIDKASLYMHGLASTQYFEQGNKRTAWAVTESFLKLNGVGLRDTPVVAREALLLATAIREAKDFDKSKVSEWLREHVLTAADHVDRAILGSVTGQTGTQISDLHFQFPSAILGLEAGGGDISFGLLNQLSWRPHEVGSTHTVSVEFEQIEGERCTVTFETPRKYSATVANVPKAPWAPEGIQSWSDTFVFTISALTPVKGFVRLLIDNVIAWQEHITITIVSPPSSHGLIEQLLSKYTDPKG